MPGHGCALAEPERSVRYRAMEYDNGYNPIDGKNRLFFKRGLTIYRRNGTGVCDRFQTGHRDERTS